MLVYNLDIEPGSLWLRSTPSEFATKQPFFCTEAGIFYARCDFNTSRDYKDSYLLFYTVEGCGIIRQNGVMVKLMPGQALLLNCRTPQEYMTDPDTGIWTHYWAHIDGEGMKGLEDLLIPDKRITAMNGRDESMRREYDQILKNMENASVYTTLQVSLAIHNVLTNLAVRNSVSRSRNQKLIMDAADHISLHWNEEIPLSDLLAISHMSKSYFMRLFRQYIGTTPYNYMLSLRITKAKEYLEMTDMSVHEIASETGFSDDASFSTRFSAMAGMSPLKYRQSAITRRQAGQLKSVTAGPETVS